MIIDVAGGFYSLKKILRSEIGFIEKDFMFKAGMEGANTYLSSIATALEDKNPKEAIEMMLEQYSLRGYGDFKLRRIDAKKRIVEVSCPNAIEAWAFQTNKDLQRECVCSYLSGVMAMIVRLAFHESGDQDSEIRAAETECVAQGKRECKFIIAPSSELTKLVPRYEMPRESASEHVLKLNEEILLKNLELQSLNLSLERQVRKKTEDLRKSEDNYGLLVELSPDPIIICTTEGTVDLINDAGLRMLGYESKEEVMGREVGAALGGGKVVWDKLVWQLEKEGAVHNQDIELVKKDGGKILGEISARFAVLARGRCVEAIVKDVTEARTMRKQVVEAQSEMEFLTDLLTHDITNYTVSALYFLNMLRKSASLADEERMALMTAIKDMQGAFELSSSVRDLSRIKAMQEEDIEVKELQTLIAEGIEESKRMYSEKKVRINFDRSPEPKFVRGNPIVSRIFTNLLTNAVKFDPSPEVIVDISIESEVNKGLAFWKVSISDHGPGIPDPEKERVFERFYRINSAIPGTGLGLFVVRFIAKACGGNVWAEDRVPGDSSKGAKIVVVLQKATERQVAAVSKA